MFIFIGYAFLCLFLREWRLYFENDSIAAFITDTADFTECLFCGNGDGGSFLKYGETT